MSFVIDRHTTPPQIRFVDIVPVGQRFEIVMEDNTKLTGSVDKHFCWNLLFCLGGDWPPAVITARDALWQQIILDGYPNPPILHEGDFVAWILPRTETKEDTLLVGDTLVVRVGEALTMSDPVPLGRIADFRLLDS